MSGSPTRPGSPGKRSPSKSSPGKRSPSKGSPNKCREISPQKPGIVGPRQWEPSLTVKCRLCGGQRCRRCSESAALAKTDSPITGLHADWATESMLGMMRPSSRLIETYRIIEQFHSLNIKAVFNLTLPGEHPYCGDGLLSSGFPYDPETDFMANKIQFFNFGWEDMTAPALSFMVDLVKVMTGVLDTNQRLAVHCHAGYGRTGLAIACALVFQHDISAQNAIDVVRRGRPGSIQTSSQVEFVKSFYDYIHNAKLVYAIPTIHERFTIQTISEREHRQYHHNKSSRGITPPRIVSHLCKLFETALISDPSNAWQLCMTFLAHLPLYAPGSLSLEEHLKLLLGESYEIPLGQALAVPSDELGIYKVRINNGDFATDIPPEKLPGLLLDWFEHLKVPLLDDPSLLSDIHEINSLPLLTLRTLEAIQHLISLVNDVLKDEHDSIVNGLVIRSVMACFQFNSIKASTHSNAFKTFLESWQCPRALPLNRSFIAQLTNEPAHDDQEALPRINATKIPHSNPLESSAQSKFHQKPTYQGVSTCEQGHDQITRDPMINKPPDTSNLSKSPPRTLPAIQAARKPVII